MRRPWVSRPFLAATLALAILFGLLITAVTRLAVNESRLAGEPAEGVIWFSSQGQYEAMRLADTALLFQIGRVSRDELILRFDLLDSRVRLFEEGEMTRRVAAIGFSDEIAAVGPLLDAQRAKLEGLQPNNTEDIADLHNAAQSISLTMREFANAGMLFTRDRQEGIRNGRRQILFELSALLIGTLAAGVLVAVIVVRGLRSTVRAEAALEHEREVSRLHRAFTSVVSHQFRTPLAIIDASSQRMLRRGVDMSSDEIVSRVTKIRNACQRLTRLMESTLNAARLEQGEISFHARNCNLHHLIASVCDSQPEEDQQRIVQSLDELPQTATADDTLLEQAVQNLVSNALKYSPATAPITISGARHDSDVVISVEDWGVGIPSDEIHFVGERFFRARTSDGVPGTGIGLSFVAQIMKLHGGRLVVQSTEGSGSTVTLRFPYRPPEGAARTGNLPLQEAQAQ